MEPRIQYAKTSDGVSIAYCVLGEGRPLVYASNVWGDLQWYLHNERTRSRVDALVDAGWQVVRYDGRGTGSSDRNVADFSLDARVRDLQAVVDHIGIERFVLCGFGQGGPPSIVFSVEHPERVSHLALVNTFAVGATYHEKFPAMRALINLRSMAADQWEFFTRTLASAVTGFEDTARANATAAMFRQAMSPSGFVSFVEANLQIDVSELLPHVQVPTLVVQDSTGFETEDLARDLASNIPGACFVNTNDYTDELHGFAFGSSLQKPSAPIRGPAGTAIILFADIADSTALTERLGDSAFRAKARELDDALRTKVHEHGGTAIEGKLLGDGVLATFASARDAIECAQACRDSGDGAGLPLHLGLHAGDVLREEGNVFGGAVNIASRIADESAPGEVLVSDIVRGLARTSAGVTFEERGEHALKGIAEPQKVFAVRKVEQ
jgi:class 3 adenylate cyclase/pimeloyl-ACP methyl ester carboxylesterase